MGAKVSTVTDFELQERMIGLIRAFGLHKPDETRCGRPVAGADSGTVIELTLGEQLLQKDLLFRLRLEKSTLSRLVKMLEGRGWTERSRSPDDGRAMELRLTEAGKRTASTLAEARREKFARILEAIPEEKRASVIQALGVLEEAMNESW